MPTCRCNCAAYKGSCDCRYDGLTQGRQRGYDEAIADVVAWLSDSHKALDLPLAGPHVDAWDAVELIARRIESGEWRK